jgi:hypothetical protein
MTKGTASGWSRQRVTYRSPSGWEWVRSLCRTGLCSKRDTRSTAVIWLQTGSESLTCGMHSLKKTIGTESHSKRSKGLMPWGFQSATILVHSKDVFSPPMREWISVNTYWYLRYGRIRSLTPPKSCILPVSCSYAESAKNVTLSFLTTQRKSIWKE